MAEVTGLAKAVERTIPVYILGRRYEVPEGLTIQKALEWAGYRLTRGCGCRGGFCGACATVYRNSGDYRLKVGLACTTLAEPEMHLANIPFFPAPRSIYDLDKIKDPITEAVALYPNITRCYGCATCVKACPQNLNVMGIIAAVLRGNLEKAAELSFDCLMCGLCAARCPAEIAPYNVAMYARRAYVKFVLRKSSFLAARTAEIRTGKYDEAVADLTRLDTAALKRLYAERDMEVP
ncbi:MAG: 4Fe-4S dicluster domain-containing protein [Chloroflexi bacterium]|nr:4Fe-4S dicluster domain-containing protein [Chloroflexota bacterium]